MIREDLFYMQFLKKDKEKYQYKYTDKYIEFIIALETNSDLFSKKEIEKILSSVYGQGHIRNTKIVHFCNETFVFVEKNIYELTEQQKLAKDYISKILFKINNTELKLILSDNEEENILRCGKRILNNSKEFELFKFNLYLYFIEKESIKENILSKMNSINIELLSTDISFFVEDSININAFLANDIVTINDIKKLKPEQLLSIFLYDKEKLYDLLEKLTMSIKDIVANYSNYLYINFDEVELKLLSDRFITGRATLEDIGSYFGVTRERIRQKESKLKIKLLDDYLIKESKFIVKYTISLETKPYVDIDKLESIVNDNLVMNSLVYIINEDKNSNYSYEQTYKILYDSSLASIEGIINDNTEKYNEIIKLEAYKKANNIQKRYIDLNYRLVNNIVFIKKGLPNNIIFRNEIIERFPNGIKIIDENYDILREIIITKYGSQDIFPNTLHSLMATIERIGFTLRDRGTYIADEFSVKLPDYLYKKILIFVEKYEIAPFSSLYQEFKKELLLAGIDNQYYLKGCIDKKLEKEYKTIDRNNEIEESKKSTNQFKTDRDAIYFNKSEYDSISELILKKMRSYEKDFSIKEIKEELPSFKNFNFANIILSEQQNGLIKFDFNTYIYVDKLNIEQGFIEMINNTLKECLDNNELHAVSMNKFYIKMKLKYGEFLKQYGIDNSNKLFFVAENYCDNYYFNKPMISSDEKYYQSQYAIICNYVKSLDKFSFDDVKEFIRNQRFHNLWSYSDLLIEMSSDFVQINIDSMISTDIFEISKEELSEIDGIIRILLRNGIINTKSFKGYPLFPKLKYIWNKYLLIGIIRTFMSDKYEVENTESHYDKTDYIIRSVNIERDEL